ncbi:KpsF/GutQ family sugar-phosphate isomerase [Taylorella equigenitalis]|uniref:Arabinose 5-phosphate isomerase n=2 Tax=Taylorella equigenitalis TaxID=29575 RepID=A0A654KH79_TAYEM|nr:KpsF/GutQ family sugar-phosphate isomerase [Taylorella equigenitalis]ADU91794.1 Arabinose 5-phosphate isomerase [Taylorella equigenitalis MCE9]ASY30019.1 D-arabinose 5-phosphate isomerase [Taylorella equigenitalis]ASY37324.1 KpsF/GutQ family sugar-phosphate isomerase [Taylorella equigenitalis]ASY41747.1 D-arabinose 5-phosphate isomerase [Taylorella equigenitalis]KGK33551.1 D-arabinose 5-phosphate isomerase [Taylorella equigenitalis]
MQMKSTDHLESARTTFNIEASALQNIASKIGHEFIDAVELILARKGRVIVTGIGKSGHVARKIASTLSSTGTAAYFVHAAEAIHGDLGMITKDDIVIAISYSGQSAEFATILPIIKRSGAQIIAITGGLESELAQISNIVLNVKVEREACPMGLAPTTSTTATMAMGDAIAIACLKAMQFSDQDFARSHPGGALGRKLLTKVSDIMRPLHDLPIVSVDATMDQILKTMSSKTLGMACSIDDIQKPKGIFTDGDLRRLIQKHGDVRSFTMSQVMSKSPKTISEDLMATEALNIMEAYSINLLLVTDEQGKLAGALHMQDLLRSKVI